MRLASEGAGSLHRKEGVSSGSGVVPVGFQYIDIGTGVFGLKRFLPDQRLLKYLVSTWILTSLWDCCNPEVRPCWKQSYALDRTERLRPRWYLPRIRCVGTVKAWRLQKAGSLDEVETKASL